MPLVVHPGSMVTVAGNGMAGYLGDGGPAPEASLRSPSGVAVDSTGNIYVADTNNNVIRCVWKASGTITTIAGTGLPGYSGDGTSARLATLNTPMGLAVDSMNNLLIVDHGNHVIRKVDSQGTITTLVGNGTSTDRSGSTGDGGLARAATLWFPTALTLDTHGNLYIADSSNSRIRYVDAKTQIITTVAGTGDFGYAGDGGPAINATLNFPLGVAVAPNGDIYISDSQNSVIRKVSATDGSITSLKFQDASGTNYQATFDPTGLTISGDGSLYVSDDSASVIWRINPASGVRSIEVGIDSSVPQAYADSTLGMASYNGPHSLLLNLPEAVTVDGKGNLVIADSGNAAVRVETFQSGTLEYFSSNSAIATLTNPNPVPVVIISMNLTGVNAPDFTLTNTCLGQLAAAANCTISVAFSPSTLNLESASLRINDNVTSGPQTITLVGVATGVAVVSPSPPSLQFTAQVMQARPSQTSVSAALGNASAAAGPFSLTGQTGSSPATPGAGTDTLFFNSAKNVPEALDASGNLYAMPPASILTAPANGFYAGLVGGTTGAPNWRPLTAADVSNVYSALVAATRSSSLSDGPSLVKSTSPNTFTSSQTFAGPIMTNNSGSKAMPAYGAQALFLGNNYQLDLMQGLDFPGLFVFSSENYGYYQAGFYNTTNTTFEGVPAGVAKSVFGFSTTGAVMSFSGNYPNPTPRNLLDDGSGNTSVSGQLQVKGFASTVNVITSAYTTVNTDLIVSNSATASFTVTLLASPAPGTIKEITNESTHPITIAVPSGVTLAGAANGTITLAAAASASPTKVILQYDGSSAWHVI